MTPNRAGALRDRLSQVDRETLVKLLCAGKIQPEQDQIIDQVRRSGAL